MTPEEIQAEWDAFIDYPEGSGKLYVTTTSALIFARTIVAMAMSRANLDAVQCTCAAKDMPVGTCCKVRSAFEKWYDEQNDGRLQPFDVFKGGWGALQRMIPTSQPPQSQAGAVPLTCEWAHNENDGFWESACGEAWRFDDGGPAENSMHFCHSCGKSLRIKGKEAGNAE